MPEVQDGGGREERGYTGILHESWDGTVAYLDCSGGDLRRSLIKLLTALHTHTLTHK